MWKYPPFHFISSSSHPSKDPMKGEFNTLFHRTKVLKGRRRAVTCSRSHTYLGDRNTAELRLLSPSKSFSSYTTLPSKSHFTGGRGDGVRWQVRKLAKYSVTELLSPKPGVKKKIFFPEISMYNDSVHLQKSLCQSLPVCQNPTEIKDRSHLV